MVAAWPDTLGLSECLEALAEQRDEGVQVIVVSACEPGLLQQRFPWADWVKTAEGLLIPQLWGQGAAQARHDFFALTTAMFVPRAGWVACIRDGHARLAAAGIGGPIDPPVAGGMLDWATFFLRYSAYLGYEREQEVPDLAGDNASYSRGVLAAHPELLRDGFWEHELHRRLRDEGGRLWFLPRMRVLQARSFGLGVFLRQRFEHGRRFGLERLRRRGMLYRCVAALFAPLIVPLLLLRVARRVLRRRRFGGRFLASLPALVAFATSWMLGEASAYYWSPRQAR